MKTVARISAFLLSIVVALQFSQASVLSAFERAGSKETVESLGISKEVEQLPPEQKEERRKVTVEESESPAKERKPNLIYRGVEGIAHGIYYAAKAGVVGFGKVVDALVSGVRSVSRKIYGAASSPFCREEKNKTEKSRSA